MNNFFAELKRRNVYKVAVAYIVAGWALSQGIAQVLPVFDIPNLVIRLIVLLIIVGLPVALILAWMFEMTPEGIKRTATADAMPSTGRSKTRSMRRWTAPAIQFPSPDRSSSSGTRHRSRAESTICA